MEISLRVIDSLGNVLAETSGQTRAELYYTAEYKPGDRIALTSDAPFSHLYLRLDDSMSEAFTFLASSHFEYVIPTGEALMAYSPKAFRGNRHLITARPANAWEISAIKNLAHNPWDRHDNGHLYPHISAEIECRDESVFAARNAIDGMTISCGHGDWPYTSWGLDEGEVSSLKIEFGRNVNVCGATVFIRSDFPHDAWWERVAFEFPDGTELVAPLIKTCDGQEIRFPSKSATWILMKDWTKADDLSPFPALSQIMFWGNE